MEFVKTYSRKGCKSLTKPFEEINQSDKRMGQMFLHIQAINDFLCK